MVYYGLIVCVCVCVYRTAAGYGLNGHNQNIVVEAAIIAPFIASILQLEPILVVNDLTVTLTWLSTIAIGPLPVFYIATAAAASAIETFIAHNEI